MFTNGFEELYSRIEKIIDISNKAPLSMKDEVFRLLFESAKNETSSETSYKELIIKLSEGKKSVREFLDAVKANSNIERSLTFVFYLEQIGINSITAKHISACYELAQLDEPGNLLQNLRDCSNRYEYLINEQSYYKTTEKGRKFCNFENTLKGE